MTLATWIYVRGAVRLRLTFLIETLDSWEVVGPVTPRLSKPESAWSINQRWPFPQRVTAYLSSHSSLPPTQVYALYRACPQPGMSEAEVIASWGEPSDRHLEAAGQQVVLRYGFGVEGQHDRLVFEGDSLVTFEVGGPTF